MSNYRKPSGKVSKTLRNKILERDNYTCAKCGFYSIDRPGLLHVDHKHPSSKYGPNTEDNLWTLCGECNMKKGSKTPECPYCGRWIIAGAPFCQWCNARLPVERPLNQNVPTKQSFSSFDFDDILHLIKIGLAIVCLVVGLVLVIGVGKKIISAVRSFSFPAFTSNNSQTASSANKIIDQIFVVEPNKYYPVAFSIPSNVSSGRIFGGFRVTAGESVAVWILNESEYQLWSNGQSVTGSYQSGMRNTAKINRKLSSGNYYLVFQNTSPYNNSTVAAEFDVEY